VFIEAKDDGPCGDNWSCKSCKAPVKSSTPSNQHPVFYRPDALPVAQPSVKALKGINVTMAEERKHEKVLREMQTLRARRSPPIDSQSLQWL